MPKQFAVLTLLMDLKDAVAENDSKAVQDFRVARLVDALGGFSESQDDALQQVFEISGRWVRRVDGISADMVLDALKHAILLFQKR
jgi:hypothetical protein